MSDLTDILHDIAELTHHPNHRYHVLIGADPLGSFSQISGLSYQHNPFEWKELGRNHSARMLPFDGPGQPGELQLRSGMIVRQMLYDWMNEVHVGREFRKDILIIHFTRKWLPLRIYFLTGCWPKSWEGTELSSEGPAEMSSETLTLVFDQVSQVPFLGLTALADSQMLSGLTTLNEYQAQTELTGWEAVKEAEEKEAYEADQSSVEDALAGNAEDRLVSTGDDSFEGTSYEATEPEEATEGEEKEAYEATMATVEDALAGNEEGRVESGEYVTDVGEAGPPEPVEVKPYSPEVANNEPTEALKKEYEALAASSDDDLSEQG